MAVIGRWCAGGGRPPRPPAHGRHLHAQIWPRYSDDKLVILGLTGMGKYGHPYGKATGVFDLARAVGSGEVCVC